MLQKQTRMLQNNLWILNNLFLNGNANDIILGWQYPIINSSKLVLSRLSTPQLTNLTLADIVAPRK